MKTHLCPVCRSQLNLQVSSRLPFLTHVRIALGVGVTAYLLSLFSTQATALKSLFLYFPLWGLAELVHYARFRESMKCGACGFDPQLYRRDWKAARDRVEERLRLEQEKLVSELNGRTEKIRRQPVTQTAPERGTDAVAKGLPGATRVVSLQGPSDKP